MNNNAYANKYLFLNNNNLTPAFCGQFIPAIIDHGNGFLNYQLFFE
jgi:hypothetical protein